jgi:hypothetical protein
MTSRKGTLLRVAFECGQARCAAAKFAYVWATARRLSSDAERAAYLAVVQNPAHRGRLIGGSARVLFAAMARKTDEADPADDRRHRIASARLTFTRRFGPLQNGPVRREDVGDPVHGGPDDREPPQVTMHD